ncbi:outer membrane protein assembly factor BamA [Candidatus Albibeggiatoa sp. nov. NOAA]|uniref:outer membrane protein assembly factor BamA n=1 Tax=Candidatus Albibeggiatoa sp. nov. NOAA TaxID=3162724 RepID=UPI0032F8AF3B|nr:outer membrane protein assembly factor BamA [Thiotrichaceae bacterium]
MKTQHTLHWLFKIGTLLLSLYIPSVWSFSAFTVEDIRLEGLRRISAGTVFNYLPIKVGDEMNTQKSSEAISSLFKTGLFKNVQLGRDGGSVVITLEERPAIAQITFDGNKDMETDDLKESLKKVGFAEGRVFNQSLLDKVEQELQRLYFSKGKYAVKISSEVTPLVRNRVGILLNISEGLVAKIRHISVVGNQAFDDDDVLDEMQLDTGGWFSFFTKSNQYSREKLSGDIETIRSFYQDQGYVNFTIDSTQVSISPDKKDVYITINLTEGDKYTISDIKIIGNLILSEEELQKQLQIESGEVFSRKAISASSEALSDRVGEEGYFFANVNAIPDVNDEDKTVALNFFMEPGKRTYVRRINFSGNIRTRDEVMRREMRQMESAWVSTKALKRSKNRLERLNYFEQVDIDTSLVQGTDDQIDVNYNVIEMPSGNLMAGLGYSQTYGVLFNASVTQDNFLGTGKRVGFSFNNSEYNTLYSLSYFNPYTDVHGVSRNASIFFRETDAAEANLSRYATDAYGGNITYGIPLSEFNSIRIGGAFDHTEVKTTDNTAQEVHDFLAKHGETYDSYRITAAWAHDTRNRALFADRGTLRAFSAEISIPGISDLEYYKVSYRHQWLYPLTDSYTLFLKGDIGYGDTYNNESDLPFYENYIAGGPQSVRGFEENTLGPLDSLGRSYGGNLKTIFNAEVILPVPFVDNVRSLRLSAFVDGGNVFGPDDDFDVGKFRYSAGLSAIWVTPVGVMTFSVARPLKKFDGDRTQVFQFAIGTNF